MKQGICHLSQIPLRGEPKSSSEMVSQLIFGETYDILSQEQDWFRVRMHYDGYEGWLSDSSVFTLKNEIPRSLFSDLYRTISNDVYRGDVIVSLGSEVANESDSRRQNVAEIAKKFLGTPYLWGGRHFSGIDCSGFVQIVYKVLGKKLPRDASQQQKIGKSVSFNNLYTGDLVFFDKDEKIGHVGLFLGDNKIIHSHGSVRIDDLTKKGIINSDSGEQTHHYHSAKRLF